jgi:glycosyltransferase involved in cell wall biosynthesis
MSKKVLIFTKKVLPRSNTFVANQGNNLPNISPIYIGFKKDNTGLDLIAGQRTCVQEEHQKFNMIAKLALEKFSLVPSGWRSALQSFDADIIHAHFGKGGFYSVPIAKSLHLPLITTFHGSDITQHDKFSYNQKHRDVVFSQSDKIIAVSKFIQQKLIARGCPQNKITQHYIGIDNKYFSPCGKKTSQPSILFVGRLIAQKGCQYLLKAMKSINKKIPDAHLIIAGYGNYQKTLVNMASGLNNIHFTGPQNREQVKALMAKSWLTCLPSIRMKRGNEEGMPTVCMESQAMGTPIVAFKTGGVEEAIEDQNTGLLVEEKNIHQLTDALVTLLESNQLRQKYSLAGILRVDKYFNVDKQCEKLENLYLDTIRKG